MHIASHARKIDRQGREWNPRTEPTPRQIVFLRTLEALLNMGGGPISAATISFVMDINAQTATWYRDNLIKFGLITRTGSGKRSSLLITDKGRAYLANA